MEKNGRQRPLIGLVGKEKYKDQEVDGMTKSSGEIQEVSERERKME